MIEWKNQSICVVYVNPEGKNKKNGRQTHLHEIITGSFPEHLKSMSSYIQWEQ